MKITIKFYSQPPTIATKIKKTILTVGTDVKQLEFSLKGFLVAQRLKCLPAMRETWARSLGQEDPLEKEMATHSSILAWRIPWRKEPGKLQSTGVKKNRT